MSTPDLPLFVIVRGNPTDGFRIHGPFACGGVAANWANQNIPNTSWWLAFIHAPTETK